VCVSSASTGLCGGQRVTAVPTATRLKAALTTWDSYGTGPDRRWLEPLLDALFSAATAVDSGNGAICARPIAT
jgi:hypothetical protein